MAADELEIHKQRTGSHRPVDSEHVCAGDHMRIGAQQPRTHQHCIYAAVDPYLPRRTLRRPTSHRYNRPPPPDLAFHASAT
jgi:hypothetical protein